MPPSGYSTKQADYLRDFLRSCAGALRSEARAKKATLADALGHEIGDIERHLIHEQLSASQKGTLKITHAFYQKMLASVCAGKTFDVAVESASDDVHGEVLGIKIVPVTAE